MSILDRINLLVRSNVNELISGSDAPERTYNKTIDDMQSSIRDARAQLRKCERGESKLLKQWEQAREEALRWEDKAMDALRAEDEQLARDCLKVKRREEDKASQLKSELEQQREYVADLSRSLEALQVKIDAAENRRSSSRAHLDDAPRRRESSPSSRYSFPTFSDSPSDNARQSGRDSGQGRRVGRRARPPVQARDVTAPKGRGAFVFDDDLRRDYPEDVFGAGQPFQAFDQMEARISDMEAQVDAAAELERFEDDPLRDDLEGKFRQLKVSRDVRGVKQALNSGGGGPSSDGSSSVDELRRQLAEDLDL